MVASVMRNKEKLFILFHDILSVSILIFKKVRKITNKLLSTNYIVDIKQIQE